MVADKTVLDEVVLVEEVGEARHHISRAGLIAAIG